MSSLLSDVPTHGLLRGHVGTVVEFLDDALEVEFSDDEGRSHRNTLILMRVPPSFELASTVLSASRAELSA